VNERRADPTVRVRLLEGAARLLAEEGPAALTLRRVAAEAGTSTMGVYTHFGSMPDLADAIVAEGFARLRTLLVEVPPTDDALADLAGLARAYLIHARRNPHLYAVMFGTASLGRYRPQTADERERGRDTFDEIVHAAERAVAQGRLRAGVPRDARRRGVLPGRRDGARTDPDVRQPARWARRRPDRRHHVDRDARHDGRRVITAVAPT
jgi:AcrR family transcriptional regulator